MKVKASIFVATATWPSMPRAIITGTVIKDVLVVGESPAARLKSFTHFPDACRLTAPLLLAASPS
jgi:hypothetical protein